MAAKPKRRKSKDEAPTESTSTRSGGVNLDADEVTIGADVVGRDKAGGHIIRAEPGATVIIGERPAPEPEDLSPAPGEPPFKGLQYFDVTDADLFFGRELLTAKLVSRLTPHPPLLTESGEGAQGVRFLAVVGASGSGKSSVVRAGLVPALKRGEPLVDGTLPPDGSVRWPVHVITPTAHPLEALAASLTRDSESVTATSTLMDDLARDARSLHLAVLRATHLAGASHVLLIVDQFEELFTLCRSEAERKAFVDNLLYSAGAPSPSEGDYSTRSEAERWGWGEGPTILVITLRADFYAHCAQFDNLREALARRQEYIGPMSADELRRAIEEPAKRGNWEFEPGLVDLLLRDVGDEPGALPLLSHALLETWKRRRGRALTLEGYAESGGVHGAIAKTAETVFNRLTPEQQAIARSIFLRLTELGEGTQDTRRRAVLDELIPNPQLQPSVESVLKILADARLVTTEKDTAEVAHEALIREWPTLRKWLDEDREGLRIHRQLTEDAQEWAALNRDPGALYRGARLAAASEWAKDHSDEMNALEREFLDTSRALQVNELEAERKRAAQLRRFAIGLAAATLIALMMVVAMLFFGVQANRSERVARARLLLNEDQTVFADDPLLGLRLAIEGVVLVPSGDADTLASIQQFAYRLAKLGRVMRLSDNTLRASNRYFLKPPFIVGRDGRISHMYHASTGMFESLAGEVEDIIFNPDRLPTYYLISYDAGYLAELRRTADHMRVPLSGGVQSVDSSPDGAYFVVNYSNGGLPSELRRSADLAVVATLTDTFFSVRFSPDPASTYFALGPVFVNEFPLEVRRTSDGSLVTTLAEVSKVAFTPDGKFFYYLSKSQDGSATLLYRSDGMSWNLPGEAADIEVSPDGRYLVISYANRSDELIRTADGKQVPLTGQVASIQFLPNPNAAYFIVQYRNGTIGLHRSVDGTPEPLPDGSVVSGFSQDPARSYIAFRLPDDTIELWHSLDGTPVQFTGPVESVEFSPDPNVSYLVVHYVDGRTEVRHAADNTIRIAFGSERERVRIDFSRDDASSYLVADSQDTPGELYRTADGIQVATLTDRVSSVYFSTDPASSYFLVDYSSSLPALRRTTDGALIATLPLTETIQKVVFSPDPATWYFLIQHGGSIALWERGTEVHQIADLGGILDESIFSSDGRWLIHSGYLIDVAWLKAIEGDPAALPVEEFIQLACEGPFKSDWYNELDLLSYLDYEPQACR